MKNRVEFTYSVAGHDKVIAFLEYTLAGLSFSTPRVSQINQRILGGKASDNFQRLTVHLDGRTVMHLVDAPVERTIFDNVIEPLRTWSGFRAWRFEQTWEAPDGTLLTEHLPNAKSNARNTHTVNLDLVPATSGVVAVFCLIPTLNLSEEDQKRLSLATPEIHHPNFNIWIIRDGFPYVVVAISGSNGPRVETAIHGVGRDYRTI